jgi:hypothetical protein
MVTFIMMPIFVYLIGAGVYAARLSTHRQESPGQAIIECLRWPERAASVLKARYRKARAADAA